MTTSSVSGSRTRRAFALAAALFAVGCDQPQPNLPTRGTGAAPPRWLPAYSKAQLALLAPEGIRPRTPARRTYPDLTRFSYTRARKLEDPTQAMRFLRVVLSVIEDSPRVYLMGDAAPSLANEIAQYGPTPPAEPDGLAVPGIGKDGEPALVRPAGAEAAAREIDAATALVRGGKREAAIATLRRATGRVRDVPGLFVELGNLLGQSDPRGAEEAFTQAIHVDASLSSAHLGLATMWLARGDRDAAQIAVARAIALHPPSPRAQRIAALAAEADGPPRPAPIAIFLDVDVRGAVRAATDASLPSRSYAGCRAIVRYEPEVRALLHGEPGPYHLGVVEEVICLEAAIGAYLVHRDGGAGAPEPIFEALYDIAREEGLTGYAMFEILGKHRPERARLAPAPIHEAEVAYVLRHVLGAPGLGDSARLAATQSEDGSGR